MLLYFMTQILGVFFLFLMFKIWGLYGTRAKDVVYGGTQDELATTHLLVELLQIL